MTSNTMIILGVVTMFLAVASTYLIKLKTHTPYYMGSVSGFVLFILSIIISNSLVSDIIGLVAIFLLVSSLPVLIKMRWQQRYRKANE